MSTPITCRSKITTSVDVSTDHFKISVGNGYCTFSVDEHGNKSVMIKTVDLDKVTQLFAQALAEWNRAKEIEKAANPPKA